MYWLGGYLMLNFCGWKSLDFILGLLWTRRGAGGGRSLRPQSKVSMS